MVASTQDAPDLRRPQQPELSSLGCRLRGGQGGAREGFGQGQSSSICLEHESGR